MTFEGKIDDIHIKENRIVINDQAYEMVHGLTVTRHQQTYAFDRLSPGLYVRYTLIKHGAHGGMKISSIEVVPKPSQHRSD